ncbi:MAG TPA: metal ABC transporter permease, partial [Chlamydiales bacterium]
MNPYSGVGFFEFFGVLFSRIGSFLMGRGEALVSDEVQLGTLICSAVACGFIGPFVVLKKVSMFANSLSHTTLLGVVIAFLLVSKWWGSSWADPSTLLLGALLAALATAGLSEVLGRVFRLSTDASIGLVFSSLFALGIVLVTLFLRNVHLGVEAVMGNADALQFSDLVLAAILMLFNGVLVLCFYRPLSLLAFDESFARTLGFSMPLWRLFFFFLTSLTCITAFRSVGVLVVLALLIGPYLTARFISHQLSKLLFWTPLIGVFCCLIAVAASRSSLSYFSLPLSTGGILTAVIGLVFGLTATVKTLCSRR